MKLKAEDTKLEELREALSDSKDRIMGTNNSEDRERESAVLLNIAKAISEINKPKESNEERYLRWGIELATCLFAGLSVAVKFYDVKARMITNHEAMYMEEIEHKFINPKYWNGKSSIK